MNITSNDIFIFFIYAVILISVMIFAQAVYRFFRVKTEWTRKIVHIGAGIVALTYVYYIHNHFVVFALTLSFTLILLISKKFNWFSSIFSVERKSYGELIFVWIAWILFWFYQYTGNVIYFYLPFSILVFADPFAAILGTNFPLKKYTIFNNSKSFGGSFAFFIISFILSYHYFSNNLDLQNILAISFLHSFILTTIEAISVKGFDNFTVPLFSVIFIFIIQSFY